MRDKRDMELELIERWINSRILELAKQYELKLTEIILILGRVIGHWTKYLRRYRRR